MRRPLFGRDSVASLAIKPLVATALAIGALLVAPAAASAAPAGTITTIAQDQAATSVSGTASSGPANADAGINVVFDCRYFSRSPFQVISFTCLVSSGNIRVAVTCADGRVVWGPTVRATGGWHNFDINCAPARISTFQVWERG
ncbi:hypothetical protein JOF56_008729 [Kibdelosporangium banguiense]|uniref:Uncharacterized protein n=1 Tax=Kibdelosporangium banguiense TaxID=1365924 RepID=A0ABS4TWH5_9PSEU|nr:hypothetical protein [Kibdelosporangium banguiense]MBP2328344.1 hypothetical protein [Kibdelosporangium banguiense]